MPINRLRRAMARLSIIIQRSKYRKLSEKYELPDRSKRIYCYHIWKTGGTSLHSSFMSLGGEDPAAVHWRLAGLVPRTSSDGLVFVAHAVELIEEGAYFYAWSHRAAHELRLPPHTFTVAVFRDPVRRVQSIYRMLLGGPQREFPFPHSADKSRWTWASFDDFLSNIPRERLLGQLFMFSKTFDVDEAVERARHCSFFFFNEEYEYGLAELGRKLGLPLGKMRRERVSRERVVLADRELERLRSLLEPEYRMIERLKATKAAVDSSAAVASDG
jgi:hypothetical protein